MVSAQAMKPEVLSKAAGSATHFAVVVPAWVPRVPRAQSCGAPPLPRKLTPTKLVSGLNRDCLKPPDNTWPRFQN